MKYTEALDIPAKCQKCPVLHSVGHRYDHLTDEANAIIMGLMNGSSEEKVIAGLIHAGVDPEEAARAVDEDHDTFREFTNADVAEIDAMRDGCVSLGQKTVDACGVNGTLSMRATRDGQQVTATICMSGMTSTLAMLGEFEPVFVKRQAVE